MDKPLKYFKIINKSTKLTNKFKRGINIIFSENGWFSKITMYAVCKIKELIPEIHKGPATSKSKSKFRNNDIPIIPVIKYKKKIYILPVPDKVVVITSNTEPAVNPITVLLNIAKTTIIDKNTHTEGGAKIIPIDIAKQIKKIIKKRKG